MKKSHHVLDNVFSIFDKEEKRMKPISNEEYETLKNSRTIYWTGDTDNARRIYQENLKGNFIP